MTGFVHLLVHTEYSISDSLVRTGDLARRTSQMSMPAVAMTDRCALFGLVKFYEACLSAGVKPIVGADFHYRHGGDVNRCVLLAASNEGYANLLRFVSRAYVDTNRRGRQQHGLLERQWILSAPEGLIALSGGPEGDVGRALLANDAPRATRLAEEWTRAFGDRYYIEVRRTDRAGETDYLKAAVDLCAERSLPVVATNDVCFLDADDFEAHETRVCIQQSRTLNDPRRERRYSEAQYLRSAADMAALFEDLPEALENTVEIAKRCNLDLELGVHHPPNYPTANGESLEAFLRRSAAEGLEARLQARGFHGSTLPPTGGAPTLPCTSAVGDASPAEGSPTDAESYAARLDHELGIIEETGFAGYFLVVAEFVNWARRNGVPVGPGRGSGSGSLVAYALNVTDVDPIEYDLIFERFLNPERLSMPDIDIDFCMEGRDSVIRHVSERYGADAVSQIATFGTMAAKAVVRDVARAQGKPYGLADRLAKMIPAEVGMTLTAAVAREEELQQFIDEDVDAAEIMDMAYKLEGIVRNVGKHAGGVVIAPGPLAEYVPLYADERSGGAISQYDKDDVERVGLVKFDLLGLRTVTIINWTVEEVNAARESGAEALDINTIPLDDEATFALLRTGETTAVFQLESRGIKELVRRLAPDNIDDVIALVALYRPGPLQSGMVDDFIDRRHRRKRIEYEDPRLEDGLKSTHGALIYQEQVMYAAQVLAGFSLGEADVLRAAMGKKKPEEMVKVREKFMAGALAEGIPEQRASNLFDQMEKFSGYAFAKGHATAYGIIAYQTAWLKCHYPAEFMAAVLSADMHDVDKLVTLVNEVRRLELTLLPPDVNASRYRFSVVGGGILYGLGAVRGVGAGPVAALEEQRQANGPFTDLFDLCSRIQGTDAGRNAKNVIEPLIRAGALDCFAAHGEEDIDHLRARLMAGLPAALARAEQGARDAAMGIHDMFGDIVREEPGALPEVQPFSRSERLAAEKESLGLYLTGHPIDAYLGEIATLRSTSIAGLVQGQRAQTVAGLVVSSRSQRDRRGSPMAFVVLDDHTGRIEAGVYGDVLDAARGKLVNDAVLVVEGQAEPDDFRGSLKLRARSVETLEEARLRLAECLEISVDGNGANGDLASRLHDLLRSHKCGEAAPGCPVTVEYCSDKARARVELGDAWRVVPSNMLIEELGVAFGPERVGFAYPGER